MDFTALRVPYPYPFISTFISSAFSIFLPPIPPSLLFPLSAPLLSPPLPLHPLSPLLCLPILYFEPPSAFVSALRHGFTPLCRLQGLRTAAGDHALSLPGPQVLSWRVQIETDKAPPQFPRGAPLEFYPEPPGYIPLV